MMLMGIGKQFAIWIRFWSIHGNIQREKISFTTEAGSSFVNKLGF
jgi:hypothetical protein